ncbi:MAG: hypothetical protein LBB89_00610 [Treponema sp.]|nr:hypothetical protein [Treponema sp.]
MKKIMLIVIMITVGAGLAFAEFEFEFGIYGGWGNAAAAGLALRMGYITPAYKVAGGDDPYMFRWSLLTDFGIGYRYGNQKMKEEFSYEFSPSPGQTITTTTGYNAIPALDYNMGLITEFYFLRFIGIAIGGGVTPGTKESLFTPYVRTEIPFLFNNVKLGLGFDYIFWKNDQLPPGVTMPPGYRANLFIQIRGPTAMNALGFLFWWLN